MRPDVTDIYYLNANSAQGSDGADFKQVAAFGIKGVIHKASQFVHDKLYVERKAKAIAAGLLWGAYHFTTGESWRVQADLFMSIARPQEKDTFPWIDHETYAGHTMPLQDAINFMDAVDQAYGRPCGMYSGNVIKQQMMEATEPQREFLAAHPFWLAQYNATAHMTDYNGHPLPWKTYDLWQFTGDGNGPGPHNVPGIGHGVDISTYSRDIATIADWWKTGKR